MHSTTMSNIGEVYLNQGYYEKAFEYFEKALSNDLGHNLKPKIPSHLFGKVQCLYKLNSLEAARKLIDDCIHISQKMKNKTILFKGNILKAKINFNISERDKIEAGIEPLEKMLKESKEDNHIAELNYELALMYFELKDKKKTEICRKKAIELYKCLYKKTPNITFKDRYEELERLTSEVS